ncbi:MAG: amino acid adenylation domain-containing protein [Cyanomargarita calcarea GSE-NOS-MK-12-04C]|jgi:amino acid adenylation domain-containing protein|uniref:Amino acid adenylation domain-containing protein n=1 Tax=Cyanomargarita calcarea GSE-NOS-MK-12-04C TaxID=2839659 RepID=A0A951QKD3_9CYAN|nr:amino acid adenylation domain-containing protein [Cyanomargarita calcarea GSE-NOS-MK-12-04C]
MTLAVPTNKSKNIESIYPLSPMQEGMLFHTLYEPESRVYFTQMKYILHGNLDIFAFEQAWQQVVDRHPILRTIFVWQNGKKTLQVVLKKVNLPWTNLDWRSLSPIEQEQQLEVLLQEDRNNDFVLDKAPLMRCTLIQLAEATYKFVWSSHHLLTDGWCMPIIFKEVFAFYEASIEGKDLYLPLPRPYKDYITWLQQQDATKAAAYWQKALQGFAAPTPLVVDCTAKQQSEIKKTFDQQRLQLSSTATTALKSLAQKHRLTVSTLVQGAWGLLLSRYSGESDVIFGATVSGRPPSLSGVESMIGLFINTLPVRVKVSEETELVPWLAELQQQQVERDEYAYSSLVEIQRSSEVPPGSCLFDSLLVFENYPSADSLHNSIRIDDFQGSERTNYPLTILVIPNEELLVRFVYDRDRFDADTITRMAGHFQTLLLGIVDNPQQKLSKLPLLTDFEKNRLLVEWNDTRVDYPEKCIYQLFEEQVAKTPDAVAVVFGSEKLTYQELNSRANQLAHHLQTLGVGPEVLVGICVERSLDMIVGILAILKAGGAYVPLDPAYPQERLAYMLSNATVSVLLTQQKLVEQLPNCEQVVCLDTDSEIISAQIKDNLLVGVKPENLAYVIYTSGSTGKPKGVAMSNRSLVNLLLWQMENSQVSIEGKTLQFAPISFDVSFQEIFSTWCSGGTLVLISEDVRRDARALLRLLTETGVERIFLPFVALQQLAEVATSFELFPTTLCEIITAGEQLQMTTSLTNFLTRLPDCRLENQYGPSESHVVTAFTLKGSANSWSALPPIGRPIANTQIYILDLQGQPVPIGVPGELHIGGLGLAREYLNRPELTAQKFILSPFDKSNSACLYKTGDQARYLPDGNIEFLGRIDNQVKIRGFRIELGEIETTLTAQPQVKEAVVIVREDIPGKKRLVAYIVQTHITSPSSIQNQLRNFLKHQLPDYMVPSAFMLLDALPLTPSGKVDRRALPAPCVINDTETFVTASTPTEEAIATIWGDVLGLKQVGIHDNFFELGGHSLLATQVISRLRQTWKMELPLRRLFEKPTVAELAQSIDKILSTVQRLQSNTSSHLLNNREEIEL